MNPLARFYTSKLTAGASPFLHHHHHCRLHPRHTAVKFMKRLLHMRLLAVACVAAELTLSPSNQDARATTFSAFPLVQRDLRAADASCSPDPLFQAALVTMQRPDRYARVLVLDAACICLNNG